MVQPGSTPASAAVQPSQSDVVTALAELSATGANTQLVNALDQLFSSGLTGGPSQTSVPDSQDAGAASILNL
jgi:hypothetical protein